ncbi:MAG: SulP family inorganic anion transporter [Gallionellaceae bacterium]|nr:SulP family inorganic anion transporter [Gallionellaceae bacterium]
MKTSRLHTLLPFLGWFPMTRDGLRADLVAGITVTLILVPQGMAYANLAGLPVVYGLYSSFIPVIVASLWGSLRQLHTGPTAMLSLMSAAALIPYANAGSDAFITLSIMLALMVGVLRLALGLLRLGLVVNFLSHPVVIGFTNAAALIIGLSQLNKLVNVTMPRSDFFLGDLWAVLRQMDSTHWPTLMLAVAAFAIIFGLRKLAPRWPAVLIAILLTTTISYSIGFERTAKAPIAAVQDPQMRAWITRLGEIGPWIKANGEAISQLQASLSSMREQGEASLLPQMDIKAQIERRQAWARMLATEQAKLRLLLGKVDLSREQSPDGKTTYVIAGRAPEGEPLGVGHWHFKGLDGDQIVLNGGGEVVGRIPSGLPGFRPPQIDWKLVPPLLPAALIMALLGFIEATSISKAIAAKTKQRMDSNRELVGQGLANIVGSFFHAYTVSGSFSRSAIAAREGARTGLFAIISALGVLLTVLFLTPLFYHLPQAVLAVIIMFAVFGLIKIKALLHAWKVNRVDALIGLVTFVATLAMAPALANGILVGAGLTVLLYLLRNMRPRAEMLGYRPDGSLGGIDTYGLPPISQDYIVMRFDGSLNFVNVAYFEDAVLDALARYPDAKALLIIGNGINDIDVSGEDKMRTLSQQLKERKVELYFSSLKRQVMAVFEGRELSRSIPSDHIFKTKDQALLALAGRIGTAGGLTEARS